MKTWFLLLVFFTCFACRFEEDPTLPRLYVGEYIGMMEISTSDSGAVLVFPDSRVDMMTAGDDMLDISLHELVLDSLHIGQVVFRARLSNDGMDRLVGEGQRLVVADGVIVVAEATGMLRYGRSELLVRMNVEDKETPQWIVRFTGVRKNTE